jgi:hypothetical protein
MSADAALDPPPYSLLAMLAARYPGWTIWFGQATRHWWALPPLDRHADAFIEAQDVNELVESIEAVRLRRHPPRPGQNGILFGEAVSSQAGRVPAGAWHGTGYR